MSEVVEPQVKLTKHFPDLMYSVVATPHSHYAEFKIYEIEGMSLDESEYYYPLGNGQTDNIDEAEVCFDGSVKWDGCSNWDLSMLGMFHSCEERDLLAVAQIMIECRRWMPEICPNWDEVVANG